MSNVMGKKTSPKLTRGPKAPTKPHYSDAGWKKVAHLLGRDIETFHACLKQTPYQANRALALL